MATRDEIAAATGIESGGDLTRYLANLEECGFIRKYCPVDGGKNGGTYQLIDNFTLFYLQFVKGEKFGRLMCYGDGLYGGQDPLPAVLPQGLSDVPRIRAEVRRMALI